MNEDQTGITRKRGEQTPTNPGPGTQRAKRWYLLFAGSEQVPRGGLGDFVQTFGSDDMARTAFLELRLKGGSAARWAQLAVVDGEKGIQPLCWFGIGAAPNRSSTLFMHRDGAVSQTRARTVKRRTRRLQSRRTA